MPVVPVETTAPPLAEVRDFLAQFAEQTDMPAEDLRRRLDEVEAEIADRGTYEHTTEELTVGAKLAWRNHTRCIGKLYWRSLTVRDVRHVTTPEGIRDACVDHLAWAANGGKARPLVSIFAPDRPGERAPRVRNAQLVSYAGHEHRDGTIVGDRATAELTDLARRCGWSVGDPGRFDHLPLLVEEPGGRVHAYDLPPEVAFEVPIEHPAIRGLAKLGLRWYGFPTISNMSLSIGGIVYPLVPFTGWYLAPEISARDFTDPHRYDLLFEIACALGLDTADPHQLWRDRAMVELTAAVLHSYDRSGIRMESHHEASERFCKYVSSERRKGRDVEAEWRWLVPPISASATEVFHGEFSEEQRLPDFLRPTS